MDGVNDIHFKVCASAEDILACIVTRCIVFCGEQGISYRLEHDEHDVTATHVLVTLDNEPIAAARLRFLNDYAKLERIVVRQPWRGRGIGHQLVDYLLNLSRERGYSIFKLNAQTPLEGFYAMHGFSRSGSEFIEADIPHLPMKRSDATHKQGPS